MTKQFHDDYDTDESVYRPPLLRFVKGELLLGKQSELVPLDSAFVYLSFAEGWMRMGDGKPIQRVVKEPGKALPSRHTLGDLDQSTWPRFDGVPSDPWLHTYELWLRGQDDGREMIFTTHSATGRQAVFELNRKISYHRRAENTTDRPVIAIGKGTYRSPRGPVAVPTFTITGWVQAEPRQHAIGPSSPPAMIEQAAEPPSVPQALQAHLGTRQVDVEDRDHELPKPRKRVRSERDEDGSPLPDDPIPSLI